MKFTIQRVVYGMKQSVSPKMFTNARLFTIQRLLFGDSSVTICQGIPVLNTFWTKISKGSHCDKSKG